MPNNTDNVLTALLLGDPSATGSLALPTEWGPGTLTESNAGQPLFQDSRGYFNVSTQPQVDIQMFTANGTWLRPNLGNWTLVFLFGGGGAGGSPSTTTGAYGGGAGGCVWAWAIPTKQLPSTVPITVGAGGTAISGGVGGSGGTTIFGDIATLGQAYPPGFNWSTSPTPYNYNLTYAYASGGTGGSRPSVSPTWAGTGNVLPVRGNMTRAFSAIATSGRLFGPAGGGFGGGTSSKSTNRVGTSGGHCGLLGPTRSSGNMPGGQVGSNPGGAGGAGSSNSFDSGYWRGGSGGGGATAASSGPGANGGAGGFPGGGGGGGSSGTTGVHGTGGAGGAGLVYVYTW